MVGEKEVKIEILIFTTPDMRSVHYWYRGKIETWRPRPDGEAYEL